MLSNDAQGVAVSVDHAGQAGPSVNARPQQREALQAGEKARARVNMACKHCRQRKIRCDGSVPQCNNCAHLGRPCAYEPVPIEENLATRDRKRRNKKRKMEQSGARTQFERGMVHSSSATSLTSSSSAPDDTSTIKDTGAIKDTGTIKDSGKVTKRTLAQRRARGPTSVTLLSGPATSRHAPYEHRPPGRLSPQAQATQGPSTEQFDAHALLSAPSLATSVNANSDFTYSPYHLMGAPDPHLQRLRRRSSLDSSALSQLLLSAAQLPHAFDPAIPAPLSSHELDTAPFPHSWGVLPADSTTLHLDVAAQANPHNGVDGAFASPTLPQGIHPGWGNVHFGASGPSYQGSTGSMQHFERHGSLFDQLNTSGESSLDDSLPPSTQSSQTGSPMVARTDASTRSSSGSSAQPYNTTPFHPQRLNAVPSPHQYGSYSSTTPSPASGSVGHVGPSISAPAPIMRSASSAGELAAHADLYFLGGQHSGQAPTSQQQLFPEQHASSRPSSMVRTEFPTLSTPVVYQQQQHHPQQTPTSLPWSSAAADPSAPVDQVHHGLFNMRLTEDQSRALLSASAEQHHQGFAFRPSTAGLDDTHANAGAMQHLFAANDGSIDDGVQHGSRSTSVSAPRPFDQLDTASLYQAYNNLYHSQQPHEQTQ